MRIIRNEKYDLKAIGIVSACEVHCIHVEILDIEKRAKEMIDAIADDSWILKLSRIRQKTFKARAQRTIETLVNDILKKVESQMSKEFGEFLISDTAQLTLINSHSHVKVPLAELLGRKLTGNPGFDFHTESPSNLIMFGEAKYSEKSTPRAKALEQIVDFITLEKDNADLLIIESFVSNNALENAIEDNKGYVAAFSLNSNNPELIFKNALMSDAGKTLLDYPELFLIAIEV